MAEVRIHRVETSYRLRGSRRAERQRLDQLGLPALDGAFSLAIQRLGLPEESEICIRDLSAKVTVPLSRTDKSLVDHWSAALANEIFQVIQQASTRRAVVYHSRRQALIDLAVSVSRGDLRRCWAWRQLGLWRLAGAATEAQGVLELVQSLCDEPVLIVPTLRALAESDCLEAIARRLSEWQWHELAVSALSEIEVAHLLNQPEGEPGPRALREAWRVIKTSTFLRSLVSSRQLVTVSNGARRSIATLAVLDADPMLLRTPNAGALLSVLVAAAKEPEQLRTAEDKLLSTIGPSATSNAEPEPNRGRQQTSPKNRRHPDHGKTDASREPNGEELRPRSGEPSTREDAQSGAETKPDANPLDLRQRSFTPWGGLLFLLNVFEELNLPEMILAHSVLGDRPFPWVLHQLALTLTSASADDAAALAFAGLSPRAKPPSDDETPADEIERTALTEATTSIVDYLRDRLDLGAEKDCDLVQFVCKRRAEIVADPGWIEVKMSLDDVSTEIRRAALDLDPGHVSWLGIVVRFTYE